MSKHKEARGVTGAVLVAEDADVCRNRRQMVDKDKLVLATVRKLHECAQELQRDVDAHKARSLWADLVQALINRTRVDVGEGLHVTLWASDRVSDRVELTDL